jgi:hypothetical protein
MHVARLTVRVALGSCPDARDRDARLAAIAGRVREHFNVALAFGGVPGTADEGWLAAAALAPRAREARRILEELAEALSAHPDCRLSAPPELKAL